MYPSPSTWRKRAVRGLAFSSAGALLAASLCLVLIPGAGIRNPAVSSVGAALGFAAPVLALAGLFSCTFLRTPDKPAFAASTLTLLAWAALFVLLILRGSSA